MRKYNWILLVVFVACLLSIVIIGFELEDYKFETTCFTEEQANNFNEIIMAFGLSYVAGYFIYILTVIIPNMEQKKYTRSYIISPKAAELYRHLEGIYIGLAMATNQTFGTGSESDIKRIFANTHWLTQVPYKSTTFLEETKSYEKVTNYSINDLQIYHVFFNQEEQTLLSKIVSECNTFFSQLESRVKKGSSGIDEVASNYIEILDSLHLLQTKLTPNDPNQL